MITLDYFNIQYMELIIWLILTLLLAVSSKIVINSLLHILSIFTHKNDDIVISSNVMNNVEHDNSKIISTDSVNDLGKDSLNSFENSNNISKRKNFKNYKLFLNIVFIVGMLILSGLCFKQLIYPNKIGSIDVNAILTENSSTVLPNITSDNKFDSKNISIVDNIFEKDSIVGSYIIDDKLFYVTKDSLKNVDNDSIDNNINDNIVTAHQLKLNGILVNVFIVYSNNISDDDKNNAVREASKDYMNYKSDDNVVFNISK